MKLKDAVKTKNKVFVYTEEPTSGFVSDGTLFPPGFDFGEMTFLDHSDIETGIEELTEPWQHVAELVGGKERLIKFLVGEEGEYIYCHGTKEKVLGGK